MSTQAEWTIGGLAARAGVTPRTIRYYTAEGLLPPPEARGKYALYRDEHLERLRLIARLKAAYLPLSEIRAQLEKLTAEEVTQLLATHQEEEPRPAGSSASEYLAEVLRGRPEGQALPSPAHYRAPRAAETGFGPAHLPVARATIREAPTAAEASRPVLEAPSREVAQPVPGSASNLVVVPQPPRFGISAAAAEARDERAESWQRVRLAPGVELHYEESAAPALHQRIRRLLDAAHDIFHDEQLRDHEWSR